ncbi:hypothetical protein Tco_0879478 [Tanacetum coccineum]
MPTNSLNCSISGPSRGFRLQAQTHEECPFEEVHLSLILQSGLVSKAKIRGNFDLKSNSPNQMSIQNLKERISKKRTKNEAKTTKPDTEWKSVEKTKSRQSPSMKKSTQVNPDKSKVKPKATSEEK